MPPLSCGLLDWPGGPPRADARCANRRGTGPCRPWPGAAASGQHRHLHAGDGASRRREQRTARDAEQGIWRPHGARHRHPRQRGPERDWPGNLRGPGRPAHRGARRASSLRRRRAVLYPRGRLRLLVQHRGDLRKVGSRRDYRRLRPVDPHDPSRRDPRTAPRRYRRGPAPSGIGGHRARRLQTRRRSGEVPPAIERGPASLAAKEILLRRPFRRPWRTDPGGEAAGDQPRRLRSASRQDVLRDRHRGAKHAQVPGHGAAARLAGPFAGQLPARRINHSRTAGSRRATALRRRRHLGRRPRAVCGRQAAARPCGRTRRNPDDRAECGASVRG